MSFFRRRSRRQRSQDSAEESEEAERIRLAEEALAEEEAMLIAQCRADTEGALAGGPPPAGRPPAPAAPPAAPPLSSDADRKVIALHSHFDKGGDGFLDYAELCDLQLATSGVGMSVDEYGMICQALHCDPDRGVSLDALRLTYASVGTDIDLDEDYAKVFGRGDDAANDGGGKSKRSKAATESVDDGDEREGQAEQEEKEQQEMPPQAELPCDEKARLEMGDHVFRRMRVAAGLTQAHAIVLSMAPGDEGPLLLADFPRGIKNDDAKQDEDGDGGEEDGDDGKEDGDGADGGDDEVGEDGAESPSPKKSESGEEDAQDPPTAAPGERVRIQCITGKKNIRRWIKVRYGPTKLRRWLSIKKSSSTLGESGKGGKGGKAAKAKADIPTTDPSTLVVERVNFLLENQHLIPPWHALRSNSECISVWCKTGRWSTFQVSSYLQTAFMGQAKLAATVGAAASSASITVPAAGYMGWLGFTTSAPLLAVHPMLIPAIAGYGIVAVGVPMWILKRCGTMWAKTTIDLNDQFWSNAPPEVYVDCIRHWSGLGSEDDELL